MPAGTNLTLRFSPYACSGAIQSRIWLGHETTLLGNGDRAHSRNPQPDASNTLDARLGPERCEIGSQPTVETPAAIHARLDECTNDRRYRPSTMPADIRRSGVGRIPNRSSRGYTTEGQNRHPLGWLTGRAFP